MVSKHVVTDKKKIPFEPQLAYKLFLYNLIRVLYNTNNKTDCLNKLLVIFEALAV